VAYLDTSLESCFAAQHFTITSPVYTFSKRSIADVLLSKFVMSVGRRILCCLLRWVFVWLVCPSGFLIGREVPWLVLTVRVIGCLGSCFRVSVCWLAWMRFKCLRFAPLSVSSHRYAVCMLFRLHRFVLCDSVDFLESVGCDLFCPYLSAAMLDVVV
jgi:hypothetical protein